MSCSRLLHLHLLSDLGEHDSVITIFREKANTRQTSLQNSRMDFLYSKERARSLMKSTKSKMLEIKHGLRSIDLFRTRPRQILAQCEWCTQNNDYGGQFAITDVNANIS